MAEPGSTVFISYSHKDERLKNKLLTHLKVLEKQGLLDLWEDRQVGAGSKWHAQIEAAITRARVALLLVSPDFLTSDFILGKEIPPLLERRTNDGLIIFPVIVRDCAWEQVTWLSPIQARPRDGKPLAQRKGQLDTECKKIAQEVFKLLGTESSQPDPRAKTFLEVLRQRLDPAYSSWDLGTIGVAQPRGSDRPVQAKLDDMYMPLRLGQGFDPNKTKLGRIISPEGLLKRVAPLVLRGPAGSGKTTWMRWTFRQLLRRDDALPLMLVLRDLARHWQEPTCKGAARSLDFFLEEWVAENIGGDSYRGELSKLLAAESGPIPVLLVDGWDEFGHLGDQLRLRLLGLRKQHPRVLIVVTSRPYGEGRPSHEEGFEVLDIQPLSDGEIQELAYRFFLHCYEGEEATAKREADQFLKALERSPDAKALARAALLLVMMLFIGRSRPLPDKRHLLYEACIDNLLTVLPERRTEEGALSSRDQWCPADSEERLRIVAELACALQTEGYRVSNRSAIVQTWEEMAALLPKEVPPKRHLDFLAWLAGPAGLLTDRADGTLVFSHLSLQEYLTAWHLNATIEGANKRTEAFLGFLENDDFLEKDNWWETLRLWAALIEKSSPKRLDPVLSALSRSRGGISLAGTIFADGLGQAERLSEWRAHLCERLAWGRPSKIHLCAQAWRASRQEERKKELSSQFFEGASHLTWLAWLRSQEFLKESSIESHLLLPRGVLSRAILRQLMEEVGDRESVACGRIFCGAIPIWPVHPLEAGLLQVWPAHRRLAGLRLQAALASGAIYNDLLRLARRFLSLPVLARAEDHIARRFVQGFNGSFDSTFDRVSARGLAFAFAHDLARDVARAFFEGDFGEDVPEDLASELSIDLKDPWVANFVSAELLSLGRSGARETLASARDSYDRPLIGMLAEACQLSFGQRQEDSSFDDIPPDLDPLWPALARHIARQSTPEDKALLIDLAQHPEKREPPLSWGLQFIVRGDVMLEDGSVVTLDELADQVGLPRLPYLEDMPDELEVDWEED